MQSHHVSAEPPISAESITQHGKSETLASKEQRWWERWERRERWKEGEESDWWFASTGIPLLAATLGPLANVSSIAALVTSWRQTNFVNGNWLSDFEGVPYADPRWCYWINVVSLICGFLGNIFLLLNFTQRVRYIVALPATIILWYLSSGFLIAITVSMHMYSPPHQPAEGYTQGFWYAISAAVLYTVCSMLLMVNMLGHFMGHYGEEFKLSDSQRTLILQTMAFFIWLAGGAAVFARLERNVGEVWGFSDALYYCDVTILTVGFGDLVPTSDVTRGIAFPYSVCGMVVLALIVSSLYKAVRELGEEKVVQKHIDRLRSRTVQRTVTNSFDLRHREHEAHELARQRARGYPKISTPSEPRPFRTPMSDTSSRVSNRPLVSSVLKRKKTPKILLLKEEKDRFEAMRRIQAASSKFKRWMALCWSVTTFTILWCVGAVVFWQAEKETQGMSYFQALYFCYISLLTIGYGDLAPKSNAGRCFFVVWSLIAVPTMTILVGDLGDTVVAKFRRGWDGVADFTLLPREGIWRSFLNHFPRLLTWLQHRIDSRAAKRRLQTGFEPSDPEADSANSPTPNAPSPPLSTLAAEIEQQESPTLATLSHHLAHSIKSVSRDLHTPAKSYTYEEWVKFTQLIRLSTRGRSARNPKRRRTRCRGVSNCQDPRMEGRGRCEVFLGEQDKDDGEEQYEDAVEGDEEGDEDENQEGGEEEQSLVNWDWIGSDSPMMSGMSESAWLLDRLCESLVRATASVAEHSSLSGS